MTQANITFAPKENSYLCHGKWSVSSLDGLLAEFTKLTKPKGSTAIINGKNITESIGKITVPKGIFNIKVFGESISGEELFRLKSIVLKTVKK